jgi:antitoxin HigA-1
MSLAVGDHDARTRGILDEAVRASGRSKREIARQSGLHKDALLRALTGQRPLTAQEAMNILDAAGLHGRAAYLLAIIGHKDLGLEWGASDISLFFDALLAELPKALAETLGEDIGEVKPRWGAGTARMIAKTLAEHVAELARRESAFGLN